MKSGLEIYREIKKASEEVNLAIREYVLSLDSGDEAAIAENKKISDEKNNKLFQLHMTKYKTQ